MNTFLDNINWEFILAILAIAISIYSILLQRKHNTLSYKPIPVIVKYNYSSHISVKLWNKGTGPLIIKSVEVDKFQNLVDSLSLNIKTFVFVEYINDFRERAISSNDYLNMIEFKIRYDESKTPEEYEIALQEIKNELHEKIITLIYTDIFNNYNTYKSIPLNFKDSKDEIEV
ncbi:hypothetical protein JQC67_15105 [Aurantibacter crassamenti]|uniref:hypothetical protein n=1 Tax=Aurantibacter crassamenti TaxID=1837375 RepID=UPI0019394526|nr:hypothetical protein [Aurantibacter crassamenti]MBM1107481.1 hypothetical protein [Aurantibacter crassamenti]